LPRKTGGDQSSGVNVEIDETDSHIYTTTTTTTGRNVSLNQTARDTHSEGKVNFAPMSHASGEAQADFGEALVVIVGVEREAHYLAFDLPHSDECFVVAFPAETTEAILEGRVRAFGYSAAFPRAFSMTTPHWLWHGSLGDGERQKTRAFSELQSHYCLRRRPRATTTAMSKARWAMRVAICSMLPSASKTSFTRNATTSVITQTRP
jgi:transposase